MLGKYERFYETSIERARNEVQPLENAGRIAQARAFTKHMGTWMYWSSLLMAVSSTATRIGIAREGSDTNKTAPSLHTEPAVNTDAELSVDSSVIVDAAE